MAVAIGVKAAPKPVQHITYYVDAVSGNDANAGTSTEAAWKTLARTRQNEYGPGNRILLRRGQVWADQTLYIGNGRDDLAAYLPGFSASASTRDTMAAMRNSNIPQLTYGTIDDVLPLALSDDTVPETMVEYGSYGDPNSANPVVKNVMLHWTTGIYIHDIDAFKNGTEYTTIAQHDMNIVFKDYKTPGMYTDTSSHVRIKNMLSETSQEHGLYLCDSSANFIIEDSIFRNNFASGIQSNATGMNPGEEDSIHLKRNRIYGNGISGFNDVRSRNMVFYRNLIVAGSRPGDGKAIEVMATASGNRYVHNVIVSPVSGKPAVGTGNASNTFMNNFFYVQDHVFATGSTLVVSDYNGFYAALPVSHVPVFNWSISLTQWRTLTGEDSHSIVTDPGFVSFDLNGDPAVWDLNLQADSALIDAGTALSAEWGEIYSFHGVNPDIGMLEYEPSLTLRAAPADQVVHLYWELNGALPPGSTWRIEYHPQAEPTPVILSGIDISIRSHLLTGLTNYLMYDITLAAMADGASILIADASVMPSDRLLYLPIIMRNR